MYRVIYTKLIEWKFTLIYLILNTFVTYDYLHYNIILGFPKRSQIPQWLKELLLVASEDNLRAFLVFVTGSPSISSIYSNTSNNTTNTTNNSSSSSNKITVRYQTRSTALPIAHTCFCHLDIPDYKDKETLYNKLMYSIQNANTFEIV